MNVGRDEVRAAQLGTIKAEVERRRDDRAVFRVPMGGLNLRRIAAAGPQWAFGFKIEKLNTESSRAAVCSPTPRNCDVGMAILNRFESLPQIGSKPRRLRCAQAVCGDIVDMSQGQPRVEEECDFSMRIKGIVTAHEGL